MSWDVASMRVRRGAHQYLPPFVLLTYAPPGRNPYSISIASYITMRLQERRNVHEMSPAFG